jgi:ABC-2 type transport system ATP-binding protein
MISLQKLTKKYGQQTVLDLEDFQIANGTVFGLVGNNGAGKTTFFRLLLDLLQPTTGSVNIDGMQVNKNENWKKFTAAYLDNQSLIDFLHPSEYWDFLAQVNNIDQQTMQGLLEKYQPFLGEENMHSSKLIRELSSGNKQKIGIIGCLIRHPQLLILDEPFNFLDPSSQVRLNKILAEYNHSTGATILISSHNLTHVTEVCTHIGLLESGKLINSYDNIQEAKQEIAAYFEVEG